MAKIVSIKSKKVVYSVGDTVLFDRMFFNGIATIEAFVPIHYEVRASLRLVSATNKKTGEDIAGMAQTMVIPVDCLVKVIKLAETGQQMR